MRVSVSSWNHRVWRMAGPIMISNVSVPLLGAVDTAVVGHLPGPEYIGAVAIGAVIFNLLYWGFGFLRMGTTGLTAQALGANDGDEVRAILGRALGLGAVIGLMLIILQGPIADGAFFLAGASDAVDPLARTYFFVRIWAAPAALANYALLGWFFGMQNARYALVLNLVMNGVNIILDFWFVFGLDLGVAGVAWATVAAQFAAMFISLWLARKMLQQVAGAWRIELLRRGDRIRRMMGINRDIFIRNLFISGSMAVFTAIGARNSDTVLAANAILIHFQHIMAFWLDGFAHAAEALVGNEIGARNRARFRQAVLVSTAWAGGVAVATAVVYGIVGGAVIDLITDIEDVRVMARNFLPWVVFGPIYSVWSFQLDGIFVGATHTAEMRNAAVLSALTFLSTAAILVPLMGNSGLWISFFVLMLARTVTLACYYPRLERSIGTAEDAV